MDLFEENERCLQNVWSKLGLVAQGLQLMLIRCPSASHGAYDCLVSKQIVYFYSARYIRRGEESRAIQWRTWMCLRALATGAGGLAAGQNSFISCYDWHFYTHTQACMHEFMLCLSLCMSLSLIRSLTTRAIMHADIPFHRGWGYYRARLDWWKRFCVCVCVRGSLNCCAHVSSSP